MEKEKQGTKPSKKIIRRKVVCVWGRFAEGTTDFVIEPAQKGDRNTFYIEGEEQP
jgi:hypothetical protein